MSLKGAPIPAADARIMINLYQSAHSSDPNKTYAVLFSLDDLMAIQKQIEGAKGNGFAVYFATYPGDESIPPAKYANRNTVIFIPTVDDFPVFDPNNAAASLNDPGEGFNHGGLNP